MLKLFSLISKSLIAVTCVVIVASLASCRDSERQGTATVAVASNFLAAAKELAEKFGDETGSSIKLVSGSTGKLYAQIINGAPYDAFLAADRERPERLHQDKRVIGNVIPYAFGALVILAPAYPPDAISDWKDLKSLSFQHLAIANPAIAPYGRAAVEALLESGQMTYIESRIVRGENISQAYHFISSGSAAAGFIARSQWIKDREKWNNTLVLSVPKEAHQPIEQCAVQLTENETAAKFLSFLQSGSAQKIIRDFGYDNP